VEKSPAQRYAKSLEKTIESNHQYLKKAVEDFQEKCHMVTPERDLSQGMIVDIREIYKEIRDRIKEIKAIQQLLQGKYRQYVQRNTLRDKEVMEFGFLAKNCYSKFEYTLLQKRAQERQKESEKAVKTHPKGLPFQWFQSKENQVRLVSYLRILNELDYESASDLKIEERREVVQNRPRRLTLFVFTGETKLVDDLYSRIRLREHDIIERYGVDELRGVFTNLREISSSEMERVIQRLMEGSCFSKLKCLLLPIQPQQDLHIEVLDRIKKTLEEMREGEIRILRFDTLI
jgi:hypothetical protein